MKGKRFFGMSSHAAAVRRQRRIRRRGGRVPSYLRAWPTLENETLKDGNKGRPVKYSQRDAMAPHADKCQKDRAAMAEEAT
jgi:hypothetical protein